MSSDRDTTRIVRSWLEEGATQLPETVLGAVLAELPTTPQRRAGWPAWRTHTVNKFIAIGIGAAAVIVAVLVGAQLLGPPSHVGGPGAEPTPTPVETAAPSGAGSRATPAPTPLLDEGEFMLVAGTFPITVTIPAPGWHGEPGGGILVKDHPDAPTGAGLITFAGADLYVYGDPCHWSTTRPESPATTVEELVAALSAQATRDASPPVDVTLDGYQGKSITLHVPDDAVFSECDDGTFGSWGVGTTDLSPYRYHQDPGQIDTLWIVDVGGELVVIDAAYFEGTSNADVAELEAIAESARFP